MRHRLQDNSMAGITRFLLAVAVVTLMVNVLVILRSFDFFYFPGELTELDMERKGAQTIVQYLRKYAEDIGVSESSVVQDSIAKFQYEVVSAETSDKIAQAIMRNSWQVQEVILREAENLRNQVILSIISQDPNLPSVNGKASIVLSRQAGRDLEITDSDSVLSVTTVDKLKQAEELTGTFSDVVVEIEDGKPRILNSRRLYDKILYLEREVARLRAQLVEVETAAGYRSMSGPGVIVRIYDAEGGFNPDEIVHDVDVRDILNELMSAGVQGASVGGQRVLNTSSIRCVGSVILVNHQPIPVDPVVIKAVGNPDVLASSLEIIKNTLNLTKGITIEVEKSDHVVLPAYTKIPQ